MQSLSEIKSILEARGLRPQKFLGQNFLIDHNLIRKLVDSANLAPGQVVLEVGPGTGTMTEELLERDVNVIACELDRGLSEMLRERFAGRPNFTLVQGDCLETKRRLNPEIVAAIQHAHAGASTDSRAQIGAFKLVSNLPYGAATPLITVLLTQYPACSDLCVTIQREVAERLAAAPGNKEYGPVSIIAQAVAEVESVGKLPPECFWPRPDVTSAMIAIRRLPTPRCHDVQRVADLATQLFAQRRKQIGSVLARLEAESPVTLPPGVTPQMRAEELTVDQLIRMAEPPAP